MVHFKHKVKYLCHPSRTSPQHELRRLCSFTDTILFTLNALCDMWQTKAHFGQHSQMRFRSINGGKKSDKWIRFCNEGLIYLGNFEITLDGSLHFIEDIFSLFPWSKGYWLLFCWGKGICKLPFLEKKKRNKNRWMFFIIIIHTPITVNWFQEVACSATWRMSEIDFDT